MVDYQAALSNARASMAGTEEDPSIQVYAIARNAINSRANPFLEYARVREIRKRPAELTYDLVTSDHHFIANGVVVHNCDICINNMLKTQGYTFDGTSPWIDAAYGTQSAEEVYDGLYQMPNLSIYGEFVWGHEELDEEGQLTGDRADILEPEEGEGTSQHGIINKVVQAATAAKLSGAGETGLPDEIETMLKRFLQPKLPWDQLLQQFFQALTGQDYSWARPNRRYQNMYLPSLQEDESGLEHLIYYLDVSGSVSDGEVVRFNSEVKYIKETFNPHRLTLVLFDDRIQREYDFYEEDEFDEVVIVGRGGTNLAPVREHMLEHRPTAAVIFSDLCCAPMQPLPAGITIPTIWVGVNAHPNSEVYFGKLIHIRE